MGLERSMGLTGLIFFGTGTILGAGIFVVVGEVIGAAGPLAPLAYILAGTVALATGLSFSELGTRISTLAVRSPMSRRRSEAAGWMTRQAGC